MILQPVVSQDQALLPKTCDSDNLNTTQTPECTKDKYNVKIINERVSPKVPPTTYVGQRIK
jgi:hypothetical protein